MIVNIEKPDEGFQLANTDPFLKPDWRRQDAQRLVCGDEPKWSSNEPAILEYAAYLRGMDAAHDDAEKATVKQRWSALAAAHRIAQQNDPKRWEIEARLLANQSDEEIAAKCNLPPEVVSQYEAMFFDVRCRLGAWVWISMTVIGDGLWDGFRDDELGRLWRALGFNGGTAIVDALTTAFHAVWLPGEPATISVFFRERCPASLELKALIASHAIPFNEETAVEYMKIHAQLRKNKKTLSPHAAAVANAKLKEKTVQLLQEASWENRGGLSPSQQSLVAQAMAGGGDLSLPDKSASDTHDHHEPPEPMHAAV